MNPFLQASGTLFADNSFYYRAFDEAPLNQRSPLTIATLLWNSVRPFMYVTIRRYRTNYPQEITRLVNETFVPRIKKIPGFVAYYGIETKDTIWASISVFDTADGARESDELASSFIQEKSWVEVLSAPEITAGDVVAQ